MWCLPNNISSGFLYYDETYYKSNCFVGSSSLAVCFPDFGHTQSPCLPKSITVYGGEKDSPVLLNTCELEYT